MKYNAFQNGKGQKCVQGTIFNQWAFCLQPLSLKILFTWLIYTTGFRIVIIQSLLFYVTLSFKYLILLDLESFKSDQILEWKTVPVCAAIIFNSRFLVSQSIQKTTSTKPTRSRYIESNRIVRQMMRINVRNDTC